MARSDHSDRTKAERIERLKQRLDAVRVDDPPTLQAQQLRGVLKGLLDLLADEL